MAPALIEGSRALPAIWPAMAAVLCLAAWHDVRALRIPNWLVLGGAASALLLQLFLPAAGIATSIGLPNAVAGLCIGLLALLPMYAAGLIGAGDVKLLAVVGAFTGPVDVLGILVMTYIAGAVVAVAYATGAGAMGVGAPKPAGLQLPYSLAIAGGTAVWLALKVTL